MCFCSQVISKLSKGLIPQLHWLGTEAIIPPFITLKLFVHQYHHQGYQEHLFYIMNMKFFGKDAFVAIVFSTDTIHNFLNSKYQEIFNLICKIFYGHSVAIGW